MDCQEFLRLAGPHLDGELDRDLGRQLDEHATRCASCRTERARLTALDRMLDRVWKTSPFGGEFASRVARRVNGRARSMPCRRVIRPAWRRPLAVALAAAGMIAALVIWSPWEKVQPAPRGEIAEAPAPEDQEGTRPPAPPAAPREPDRSLALADGSRIDIGAGAAFEPRETERGFEGRLEAGWVRAIVEPQTGGRTFSIRTPRATAVVVGTEFELVYEPVREVTSIFVLKGEVRFEPLEGEGALTFTGGQGASIGPARSAQTALSADPRRAPSAPPLDQPPGAGAERDGGGEGESVDLPRRP